MPTFSPELLLYLKLPLLKERERESEERPYGSLDLFSLTSVSSAMASEKMIGDKPRENRERERGKRANFSSERERGKNREIDWEKKMK